MKTWQHDQSGLITESEASPGPRWRIVQRLYHEESTETRSRIMLLARLENMQQNGDRWLSIEAFLALINDCDMLASREWSEAISGRK